MGCLILSRLVNENHLAVVTSRGVFDDASGEKFGNLSLNFKLLLRVLPYTILYVHVYYVHIYIYMLYGIQDPRP